MKFNSLAGLSLTALAATALLCAPAPGADKKKTATTSAAAAKEQAERQQQQAAGAAHQGAANQLTAIEKAAGWTLLFDGKSTSAWRGYRQEAFPAKGWVIEDGCLKVAAGGGGGDIITVDQYENFELVLEYRVSKGANSGIMYRVTEEYNAPWKTGPEFQILDDAGYGAKPTDSHSAGALYDLKSPAEGKVVTATGEFNSVRIRLKDGRLQHWLNGAKVVECDMNGDDFRQRIANSKFNVYEGFGVREKGHISLQDHGNDVWFRNIMIRDLDAPLPGQVTLFDGTSLDGWTYYLNERGWIDDVWTIEDGVLVCAGNPIGYLKTEADYLSYVLMLDWRFNPVTKKAGNSGVLLRMHGEDKVWPRSVEAQLQSGNAGDFWNIGEFPMKTNPARTNGRNTKKLMAAEYPVGEWNSYEIHVNGPSVVLYVNGHLVNAAWEVKEIPGRICLQSEGAEIHFRNIRLAVID